MWNGTEEIITRGINYPRFGTFTSLLLLISLQIIVANFSSILHNFYASLQSIPPVTRMAMGRGTWVTVLCKKLKNWWHWVYDVPQQDQFYMTDETAFG